MNSVLILCILLVDLVEFSERGSYVLRDLRLQNNSSQESSGPYEEAQHQRQLETQCTENDVCSVQLYGLFVHQCYQINSG